MQHKLQFRLEDHVMGLLLDQAEEGESPSLTAKRLLTSLLVFEQAPTSVRAAVFESMGYLERFLVHRLDRMESLVKSIEASNEQPKE